MHKPLARRIALALTALAVAGLALSGGESAAQSRPRRAPAPLSTTQATLTAAGARVAIDAILEAATRAGVGASIAVVDAGGHLVAFERLDPTFAAGAHVSIGKARTAALFRRPTAFFEDTIRGGRTPMIALDDGFTPLQGGVPIEVGGAIVGAIGVSGAASAAQDEELATLGARAVATGAAR